MHAAVRGVTAVFHLQVGNDPGQTTTMIDAARAAGVHRIVMLRSLGACLRPAPLIGQGFIARERLMRESGLDVTFVRPGLLMSNALWWVAATRAGSSTPAAGADGLRGHRRRRPRRRRGPRRGRPHQPRLHPHRPEALTSRDQVEILSDVLGRPIEFADTTPGAGRAGRHRPRHPTEEAEAVTDLNGMFRAGRAGIVTDDVANITGSAPRTFRDWCQRHADAFA